MPPTIPAPYPGCFGLDQGPREGLGAHLPRSGLCTHRDLSALGGERPGRETPASETGPFLRGSSRFQPPLPAFRAPALSPL